MQNLASLQQLSRLGGSPAVVSQTLYAYIRSLSNLAVYYPMDEISGTTVFNRAPTTEGTLDATNSGATINQPMQVGKGYSFDSNDFLTTPVGVSLKNEGLISFGAVVRVPVISVGDKIIYQEPINTTSSSRVTFAFSTNTAKLTVFVRAGDSATNSTWTISTALSPGTDYIIGITLDIANKVAVFYVNGAVVSSTGSFANFNAATITNSNPNSGPFIGKNAAANAFYNSLMQHLYIVKGRLMTEAEHLKLAQLGSFFFDTDIFIIAGQSNASGRGTSSQLVTITTQRLAKMFGNDYTVKDLIDPTDSSTSQVDTVSGDSVAPAGSVWPLVANSLTANVSKNVMFVPCAKGGTAISAWLPGADHEDRTTLYGSMIYRAKQAQSYGTLKGVLWWQGESDVSTTQADYNSRLDTIANAVMNDLGIPLLPARLQECNFDASALRAAVDEAVADNPNIKAGPDLSDIACAPEDTVHLLPNAKLSTAATRWWNAIAGGIYGL
ncbi:MAG: hypothetical protein M3Q81_04465 [bacterium]|nr:hypothetical protein [bacterium]